jgi:tyrosyl-tRNA synthetase
MVSLDFTNHREGEVVTKITNALVNAWLTESNGWAKELIKSNSIYLNEQLITDMNYTLTDNDFIQGKIALLRKGKKARGSVWKG